MEDLKQITKTVKTEVEIFNHRLDQLAWLLEGNSMCTAVTILGNNFVISANEFFTGTKRINEKFNLIVDVMNYFKCVAGKTFSNELEMNNNRDEIIRAICDRQVKKTITFEKQKILNENEECFKELVSTSMLESGKVPNVKNVKKYEDLASSIFGVGSIIFRRIKKIEDYIQTNQPFSNAINNFNADYILRDEEEGGVHAELQILGFIVSRVQKYIDSKNFDINNEYCIGISKLCCLNCHCMLEASKEVLKECNIFICYDGAHDMLFEKNWEEPSFLRTTALGEKIAAIYTKNIEKYKEEFLQKTGIMEHSRSSSEASLYTETKLSRYIDKCEENLNFLKNLGYNDNNTEAFEFAIYLSSRNEEFKRLFNRNYREAVDKVAIFSALFESVKKDVPTDEEWLLSFLKNKSIMYAEIAGYFADFNLVNEYQKVQFITPWNGRYEVHSPGLSLKGASLYKDGKKMFP